MQKKKMKEKIKKPSAKTKKIRVWSPFCRPYFLLSELVGVHFRCYLQGPEVSYYNFPSELPPTIHQMCFP